MRIHFITAIFVFFCLSFENTQVEAGTFNFKFLQIDCDGTLTISSSCGSKKYANKTWIGDVSRGMLFDNNFFSIDNNELIATNLDLKEKISLTGEKLLLGANYRLWKVGYVDEKRIIFCAKRYDPDVTLRKQRQHYYLYQLDRKTKIVQKIPIENCGNANFSFHGNKIYYTGEDGTIYKFHNTEVKSLGVKGRSPTISPDGKKIAFISFGIINYEIKVYDLQTEKKSTVIKLRDIWPIIRWSGNSRFVAVKNRSDIFSNNLYLVDILEEKTISVFKNNHACNWFFVE